LEPTGHLILSLVSKQVLLPRRDPVAGTVYIIALGVFAVMPVRYNASTVYLLEPQPSGYFVIHFNSGTSRFSLMGSLGLLTEHSPTRVRYWEVDDHCFISASVAVVV